MRVASGSALPIRVASGSVSAADPVPAARVAGSSAASSANGSNVDVWSISDSGCCGPSPGGGTGFR
jgi:hypothetical protein